MRTFDQIAEAYRNAAPPTADDVPVTFDGRRIDTCEKVLAWIVEMSEAQAAEDALGPNS